MSRYNPQDYCREELLAVNPYRPGKRIEELESDLGITGAVKLASNENLLGVSPKVCEALRRHAHEVMFYPDGDGHDLRQALALRHCIEPGCITLGNGSNEILELVGRCFLGPGREVIYSGHAFAVYELTAKICGAAEKISPPRDIDSTMPYGHDLDAMLLLLSGRTRVVFIANPNNPTGTWCAHEELKRFMDRVPRSVVVVVDQAYAEYAEHCPDAVPWLGTYPNLVVTRTFSKAFGLAGLRIGYALSSPDIAALLNRIRQPFNVNAPAQHAALAALEDKKHLERSVACNRAGLKQLHEGCAALGLSTLPSDANFVCVRTGRQTPLIYQKLLRRGVIVRPVDNYRLPEYLRVTVGLPEHNRRFLDTLTQVLD